MRNYKKWTVLLGLLTISAFSSTASTNTTELGYVPHLLAPTNAVEIEKLRRQKRDAREAAEKEFQTILKTYPWAKQIERSIEQAQSSSKKIIIQETRSVQEDLDRVRSELEELKDHPFKELKKTNFVITRARDGCRSEVYRLKQQIIALAGETNNTPVVSSNRVFLEAELATANQKLQSLENEITELARLYKAVAPPDDEVLKQKELQKKFASLWIQRSNVSSTNSKIREAQAEVVRLRRELVLAISTNAPLQEAKNKRERVEISTPVELPGTP